MENSSKQELKKAWQIPIETLVELYALRYPKNLKRNNKTEYGWILECGLGEFACETSRWKSKTDTNFDEWWVAHIQPSLEKYLRLVDQVNTCIWQFNKKFCIDLPQCQDGDTDITGAVALLLEYDLIELPDVTAAFGKELVKWLEKERFGGGFSAQEAIYIALDQGRLDILKALGVGEDKPLSFKDHWLGYYRKHLGKADTNYWDWTTDPIALDVCQELTALLALPEPNFRIRQLLEVIPDGIHPYSKYTTADQLLNYKKQGRYANHSPVYKDASLEVFRAWHKATDKQLGTDTLKAIYSVVYGAEWWLIEYILASPKYVQQEQEQKQKQKETEAKYWKQRVNDAVYGSQASTSNWFEVLGVSRDATKVEVKSAYRLLCKRWHPDTCSDAGAAEQFRAVTTAYEEWEKQSQ